MNTPQRYQGNVVTREQFSQKVFLFTIQLEQPETISFTAGQFVSVQVAQNITRQYSIASTPTRNSTIDLLVDIAPGGPGSQFFASQQVGGTIQFIGPMGKFVLEREDGHIVFLATGTGIAPFKSMLDNLFEKQKDGINTNQHLYLYYGFRFEQDVFWHEYFEQKQKEHPNFHYMLTVSQPGENWIGCKGYVQACIDKQLLTQTDTEIYICGGRAMVKGTLEYLRTEHIPEERLHFEPF